MITIACFSSITDKMNWQFIKEFFPESDTLSHVPTYKAPELKADMERDFWDEKSYNLNWADEWHQQCAENRKLRTEIDVMNYD